MTDGWWRIKQHAPNTQTGFMVTEIPMKEIAISKPGDAYDWTEPRYYYATHALAFKWPDGREQLYPWASIVHAEYQPPTGDNQ